MSKDPIVEEVRAIREAYAKRFDYDIDAICRDLHERELLGDHPIVSFTSKDHGQEGDDNDDT